MIYFLYSNMGFYNDEVHSQIPSGCIEISESKYKELLDGQSDGLVISLDSKNQPILAESTPVVKNYAELRKAEYPPIEDYIDGIVKNDSQQIQNYIEACILIKQKYPKN